MERIESLKLDPCFDLVELNEIATRDVVGGWAWWIIPALMLAVDLASTAGSQYGTWSVEGF